MMNDHDFKAELSDILDGDIYSISPLSAAKDAEIFRVTMESNDMFAVKRAAAGLAIEAKMLTDLTTLSGLPVPKIQYSTDTIMVMDFVTTDWQLGDAAQRDAAEHLIKLHKVKGPHYGFEYDTPTSGLMQDNTPSDMWRDFYVQQRVKPMAKRAFDDGVIDKKLMKKIDKVCQKIPDIIGHGNPPVLIHGDCWSGNILSHRSEIVAFLDPALYYADHEIELAYATMTDTFDQSFFAVYEKEIDIKPGFFEERRDLYTLYPLLVQTNTLGRSYARKVEKVVDMFL